MKTWQIVLLVIAILGVFGIIFLKEKGFFKARILKCIDENMRKQDRDICFICSDKLQGIIINGKCYKIPNEFVNPYTSLIVMHYKNNDGKYYTNTRINPKEEESTEKEHINSFIKYIKRLPEEITSSI